MKILSLCSGYGGLDMAVEAVTGGRLTAYAEAAPAPARVMAHRFPGVPNLGDIRHLKWADMIGDYEIVAAGFPCQNISNAGDRTGIDGEKSSVWSDVADCIGIIRPCLVFLENVAAIRTRGLDRVAGDLAERGYDLRWVSVRASDVGAAHRRDRWFGLARPAADTDRARLEVRCVEPARGELPSPGGGCDPVQDAHGQPRPERRSSAP